MSRPHSLLRYIGLALAVIVPIAVLSSVDRHAAGQQPATTPPTLTPAEQAERIARTGGVQEGRARVQRRGEPMKELKAGEIDYAPPGVEHWHGAAPNEPLVQLGVVPFGGGIKFLEPVTDAQYNGQSR